MGGPEPVLLGVLDAEIDLANRLFYQIDRVNAVSTLIGRRLLKVGECGLQIAARIDHVGLSRERRSGPDRCEEERKNQSE